MLRKNGKVLLGITLVLAVICLAATGCVTIKSITYSASGKVMCGNTGIADVIVKVNGEIMAQTAEDGSFSLSGLYLGDKLTFEKDDYIIDNEIVIKADYTGLIIAAQKVYSLTVNYAINRGSVTGSGKYGEGEEVTLTASANEGYYFKNYTLNGEIVSTTSDFVITIVEDTIITVEFGIIFCVVSVTSDYDNYVEGAGTYQYGTEVTLTAVDTAEFDFYGWYADGELYSESNPLSIVARSDLDLTAKYYHRIVLGSLSYNESVLSWDAVDGATEYMLEINGENHTLTNTSIELADILELSGTYTAKVTALADSGRSDSLSQSMEIVYRRRIPTPSNIGVIYGENDIILSFGIVLSAEDYKIKINEDDYLFEEMPGATKGQSVAQIAITNYLDNGNNAVTVTALAEEGGRDSLESEPYVFKFAGLLDTPNLSCAEGVLSWTMQSGVYYELSVNGVSIYNGYDNSFDISNYVKESGEYTINLICTKDDYIGRADIITIVID